eukprot:1194578-Prorocentrum_minimum.AAC.7
MCHRYHSVRHCVRQIYDRAVIYDRSGRKPFSGIASQTLFSFLPCLPGLFDGSTRIGEMHRLALLGGRVSRYVTSSPAKLGSGMKLSVELQLPVLSKGGTDMGAVKQAATSEG